MSHAGSGGMATSRASSESQAQELVFVVDTSIILRYHEVLRLRLSSEQFDFLKEYAARSNTNVSQVARDYIGKLEKSETRRRRKEGTK